MMSTSSSWLLLLLLCVVAGAAADSSLQQQCTEATSSLTPCLGYGSGRSDRPTSECCTTVANIRETQPACLCFAVQQTHNSSSGFSASGLRVDRLLMLPGACNLANSSASNCTVLLHLSPTSPDYSIFTNFTQVSGNSSSGSPSKALMHQISLCAIFAIGLAVIINLLV